MLPGAHKEFYRIQHPEIYLLDLNVQYKHKIKLPLDMVSSSRDPACSLLRNLLRRDENCYVIAFC